VSTYELALPSGVSLGAGDTIQLTTQPPIVLPFPGFQKAHDAAMPGATIAIPPGTYQEPAPVHSTKAGLVWSATGPGVVLDASKMSVAPQAGAFYLTGPNQSLIGGWAIKNSPAAGLVVDGAGCSSSGLELASNGQEGYVLHQPFSYLGGSIHDNNPLWKPGVTTYQTKQPYDPQWEAGGGKATRNGGTLFDGVEAYRNGGPAIWFDIQAGSAIVKNCRIHDNPWAAIMFEISTAIQIYGNTIWECAWGDPRGLFWQGAVLVSSAGQATVTSNLIAWCPVGVDFVSQNRPAADHAPSTAGNSATGNLFAISAGSGHYVMSNRDWVDPAPLPVMSPNSTATAAQLAAAGVPSAPQPGH